MQIQNFDSLTHSPLLETAKLVAKNYPELRLDHSNRPRDLPERSPSTRNRSPAQLFRIEMQESSSGT